MPGEVNLRDRVYALDVDPEKQNGQDVVVGGWMQEIRDLGKIAFVILRDRTGTLQLVLPKGKVGEEFAAKFTDLPRESVIAVVGEVKANEKARNGYEILPKKIEVLSQAATPLPLGVVDKVAADLETRLDNRFMDLRKPEVQAIFKVRSTLVKAGIDSFHKQGFLQVHTPRIIGASSEGGTDLFKVKYFEKDAFLAQSPQLYKQMLMASGVDRQFEVATYFRAEKHNTPRHLNEITAFDVEMAFIESEEDVLRVLETAIRDMWQAVAEECKHELELRGVEVNVPEVPFPRVTYDEAVQIANASGELTDDKGNARELPWGEDLDGQAERVVGKHMAGKGHAFYFITRYPEAAKPFYVFVPEDNPKISLSFDLEHNGMEVTSGAQREHRVEKLEARLEQMGLDPADFEEYLKAFRYGMPPHGGFGLGIDRLVREILKLDNIREGVLFPRDRTRITP